MDEISKGIKVLKMLKGLMGTLKQKVGETFKEMKVTGTQGMLMGTLAHFGKMKVSDLSEKLGLSNSTVSGIIDRLENQGLVVRTRSEEDRRVVYVSVTDEFRKDSTQRFQVMEKVFESMMTKATAEEMDEILKGLDTLQRVLDRSK